MLSWLIDNANVVYFLLGMAALVLAVQYWLNRRVKPLFLAAVVIGFMILFWLLTLLVPTDRKRIQDAIHSMRDAILANNSKGLSQLWASDFKFQGLDRDELAKAVAKAGKNFSVTDIGLHDFDVKKVEEKTAEIWFRFVGHGQGGRFPGRCKATFVREGVEWRLQSVTFLHPVADQEIPLPLGR